MAIAMPHPTLISQNAQRRLKQRLLTAQFGDGYFTSAPDGINSIYEEWSVTWENVTASERALIVASLLQAATEQVLWTPFGDTVQKRYQLIPGKVATLFQETFAAGDYYTISAEFIQVR